MKPSGRYCIIPSAGIYTPVNARYATPLPCIMQVWKHVAEDSTAKTRSAETIRPGAK